ncbi:MAG: hypothetical protein ACAI34_05835, partial [Verrucomicrobium sp.]
MIKVAGEWVAFERSVTSSQSLIHIPYRATPWVAGRPDLSGLLPSHHQESFAATEAVALQC